MRNFSGYSLSILLALFTANPFSRGEDPSFSHQKNFAIRVKSIEVFNESEILIDNCMVSSGGYSSSFGAIGIGSKARVTYTLPNTQPTFNTDVTIEWDANENNHHKVTVSLDRIIQPTLKPARLLFTIKKDGTIFTEQQK